MNKPDFQSLSNQAFKNSLIERYGEVLTTNEVQQKYIVESFTHGYAFVMRKDDNKPGIMQFSHSPRFYFDFTPR